MDSAAAPTFSVHLIHPDDDVAVAIETVPAGVPLRVGEREVRAADEIPRGHKIALRAIAAGASVRNTVSPSARRCKRAPIDPLAPVLLAAARRSTGDAAHDVALFLELREVFSPDLAAQEPFRRVLMEAYAQLGR